MKMQDLSVLGAGFAKPSFGSQAVFRAALHALAHPGECVAVAHDAKTPTHGRRASAALLLALLDPDCKLWLSTTLANSDAAHWLRFHTGCEIVSEPRAAQFAWVAIGDKLPPLDSLALGCDVYPDQSATCVVDVVAMTNSENSATWLLTGPGIRSQRSLCVEGFPVEFVDQWERNHVQFPRGVDVFFAVDEQIVGLPRTTQLSNASRLTR
jgi:alpha-D-ribose 1-methylphosphonate 5-triphosphate synthase subunit PhnH